MPRGLIKTREAALEKVEQIKREQPVLWDQIRTLALKPNLTENDLKYSSNRTGYFPVAFLKAVGYLRLVDNSFTHPASVGQKPADLAGRLVLSQPNPIFVGVLEEPPEYPDLNEPPSPPPSSPVRPPSPPSPPPSSPVRPPTPPSPPPPSPVRPPNRRRAGKRLEPLVIDSKDKIPVLIQQKESAARKVRLDQGDGQLNFAKFCEIKYAQDTGKTLLWSFADWINCRDIDSGKYSTVTVNAVAKLWDYYSPSGGFPKPRDPGLSLFKQGTEFVVRNRQYNVKIWKKGQKGKQWDLQNFFYPREFIEYAKNHPRFGIQKKSAEKRLAEFPVGSGGKDDMDKWLEEAFGIDSSKHFFSKYCFKSIADTMLLIPILLEENFGNKTLYEVLNMNFNEHHRLKDSLGFKHRVDFERKLINFRREGRLPANLPPDLHEYYTTWFNEDDTLPDNVTINVERCVIGDVTVTQDRFDKNNPFGSLDPRTLLKYQNKVGQVTFRRLRESSFLITMNPNYKAETSVEAIIRARQIARALEEMFRNNEIIKQCFFIARKVKGLKKERVFKEKNKAVSFEKLYDNDYWNAVRSIQLYNLVVERGTLLHRLHVHFNLRIMHVTVVQLNYVRLALYFQRELNRVVKEDSDQLQRLIDGRPLSGDSREARLEQQFWDNWKGRLERFVRDKFEGAHETQTIRGVDGQERVVVTKVPEPLAKLRKKRWNEDKRKEGSFQENYEAGRSEFSEFINQEIITIPNGEPRDGRANQAGSGESDQDSETSSGSD